MKIKTFEELQRFLSEDIEDINQGGCAIAALTMKRWLQHNTGESVDIIYGYHPGFDDLSQNDLVMKGRQTTARSCYHAWIRRANGDEVDSKGLVFNTTSYKSHVVTEDLVIKSLENYKRWNHWFNRRQVLTIQDESKVDLSDVFIPD